MFKKIIGLTLISFLLLFPIIIWLSLLPLYFRFNSLGGSTRINTRVGKVAVAKP